MNSIKLKLLPKEFITKNSNITIDDSHYLEWVIAFHGDEILAFISKEYEIDSRIEYKFFIYELKNNYGIFKPHEIWLCKKISYRQFDVSKRFKSFWNEYYEQIKI